MLFKKYFFIILLHLHVWVSLCRMMQVYSLTPEVWFHIHLLQGQSSSGISQVSLSKIHLNQKVFWFSVLKTISNITKAQGARRDLWGRGMHESRKSFISDMPPCWKTVIDWILQLIELIWYITTSLQSILEWRRIKVLYCTYFLIHCWIHYDLKVSGSTSVYM